MQPNEWEIIILKPTRVFLTFLTAQLPDIDLPELKVLQTDNTAYAISKQNSDEDTLNEIEKHFTRMFRHEIMRWAGNKIDIEQVEASFLDFLCCFKFELHPHIVLMEKSWTAGQQLLKIKPRSILLKWMKSTVEEQDSNSVLEKIDVSNLAENATVIIKNFTHLAEVKVFLQDYFLELCKIELQRLCDKDNLWPAIDCYQTFRNYFTVDVHSQLIHLG